MTTVSVNDSKFKWPREPTGEQLEPGRNKGGWPAGEGSKV